MIELQRVSAGYGKHRVLKEVSVCLEAGKLTGIIGVNGCGKSTLLKTVLGMIPLQSGEIAVNGKNLRDMSRNAIAREVAYLAQGRNTPDMTVAQIVLHGRFPHLNYPRRYTGQDYEIAFSAMEQLKIADLAHKPLSTLSGGMRQNAYIAMALTQDTEYILLDEPTTYLDIPHQLELMKTLRKLADRGKGVITVTHDIQMAFSFSDRIILLHDGCVFDSGTPEEVCGRNGIAQIMGVSLKRSENGYFYQYG